MKILNLRGQSLFEVVLSLGLASLVILAIVSVALISLKNSGFSENKTLAAQYSQEATEWLRSERDRSWNAFITNILLCPGDPFLPDPYLRCLDTSPLVNSVWANCDNCEESEPVSGTLRREVTFICKRVSSADPTGEANIMACSNPLANAVDAAVKVYWRDPQGYHEVSSATNFSDWRERE